MVHRYLFVFAAVLLLVTSASSQPTLSFKRIDISNYPEISLAFTVTCGGQFENFLDPQHFRVYENGLPVGDFEIWCPPNPDCCISATLVLDRTGSMNMFGKMDGLRTGANAFIDQLNTEGYTCDEASIISFNTAATLDQSMTKDKFALHDAVNRLRPAGNTSVWDATMVGISNLISSANNHCRAVVLISDGGDNSSTSSFDDVVNYALANGVKVFTVGYGIAAGTWPEQYLNYLANVTGGQYYSAPTGDEIINLFKSMRKIIRDSYQECYLKYVSNCPDGRWRNVDLHLDQFCNGSAVQTKAYQAPLDQKQWSNFRVQLGSGAVMGTEEVMIPIMVPDAMDDVFAKSNFTIGYNPQFIDFVRAETDGTLLEGIPMSHTTHGSGVTFYTNEKFRIQGPGTLLRIYLKTADVANFVRATPIQLINWNFDGYCLIPKMSNGAVDIRPREPELHCDAYSPSGLQWDDAKKVYIPNPFLFRVEVWNTGTRESRGTRAKVRFDPNKVRLHTPQIDEQMLIPESIPVGQSGAAAWNLEALKMDDLDSVQICVDIYSDNHETITCCRMLTINPIKLSAIVCDLNAPDTVYFREQYYEPETFDVHLTAANTGDGMALEVVGQLLQDTRFTKLTETRLFLADQFMPSDTVAATFSVQMRPRTTDGYDTIWAQIQGSDCDPAWCYWPVWVQRVRDPKLSLLCTTPDDSLKFDEQSSSYYPNPFTVKTVAQNIGETYAEECQMMFVGPERFTPVGANPRPIGTLNVSSFHTEYWDIRALPRSVGGWDTLHFQVLGKGGLGRKIVVGECFLPVYVPAMRRPEYEILCDAPDSLVFDDVAYIPNPLTYSVTITNTGNAPGYNINPRVNFPSYMSLAGGAQSQTIDKLDPGDSRTLTWDIRCDKRLFTEYATICVSIADTGILSNQCCNDIFIDAVRLPALFIDCHTIDTLHLSQSSGEYVGNPFVYKLTVTNTGGAVAQDVRASISIQGTHISPLDDITQTIGDLQPSESRQLSWRILALNRPEPADISILATVYSTEFIDNECVRTVHIPTPQKALLAADCWSVPEDSLFFDWETGAFEYPVFDVRLDVTNTGLLRAENTSALLILPAGITFAEGETPEKQLANTMLSQNEHEEIVWRVRATRDPEDRAKTFTFVVRADNASEATCADPLWVQGSPKELTLSLPNDLLFRFGQKAFIPIDIGKTVGKDLSSYTFVLRYDPEVVSILNVSPVGTLTSLGWVGARMREIGQGLLEISDYTTGTPLHTEPGTLITLYAEGVFQRAALIDELGYSTLEILPESVSLNFGDIAPVVENGSIYVTNECIEPLEAGSGFALGQNRPNPFNPTTEITFQMGYEAHARITVFDKMGRQVAALADGVYESGTHSVSFSSEGLPSGMYFYRFEAEGKVKIRKMIIAH